MTRDGDGLFAGMWISAILHPAMLLRYACDFGFAQHHGPAAQRADGKRCFDVTAVGLTAATRINDAGRTRVRNTDLIAYHKGLQLCLDMRPSARISEITYVISR